MVVAPTSAHSVMIARDLVAPLSSPLAAQNRLRDPLKALCDLPGGYSPSSFVASRHIPCQSADRTARAGVIAMCFAQIIIDGRAV
jgi:hypothetical protein